VSGAYGPVVARVTEGGIQRRVELGTAANPYPQLTARITNRLSGKPNHRNLQQGEGVVARAQ